MSAPDFSVEVSYTDGNGHHEGPLTSPKTVAVTNVNDTPVGVPTITGTVTEDQILTADTSGISDADGLGAFSYQWLRNGVAIGGATGRHLHARAMSMSAHRFQVDVSYTDGDEHHEGLLSAEVGRGHQRQRHPVGVPPSPAPSTKIRSSPPTPAASATPTASAPSATSGCATA